MNLQYAGAYNSLYLIRGEELIEKKADKMPIGIYIKEKESFTKHELDLQEGDTIYTFSDGYVDQFGGENGRKFMSKPFKRLLLSIQDKSMAEQKDILEKNIMEWRGDIPQVDDIIVLGVRI
jgi:serine phosphatase RsbU (regulator of sigma subunit)